VFSLAGSQYDILSLCDEVTKQPIVQLGSKAPYCVAQKAFVIPAGLEDSVNFIGDPYG
jgi:hypothetical protein